MKRREFISVAAGLGAGSVLAGSATRAMAEDYPKEEMLQIYLCDECGAMVQVMHPGEAPLVHCDEPMHLLVEKTADKGKEKHVPVIEKVDGGYKVSVGSVAHPMTESHFITAIQLITKDSAYTKSLKPGDKPEAVFCIDAEEVTARAHCNLHGLWKNT